MSDFFYNIPQKEINIRQYKGKSPMFFRKFNMMAGVFTADYIYCRNLVPKAISHILELSPGRTLVAIHCMQYIHSDVGPYNEISISIGINPNGSYSLPSIIGAMLTNSYHAYIVQLPVTTEVAYFGGIDYFNFPKSIADISFKEDDIRRTCTLKDKNSGVPIFSFSGKKIISNNNNHRFKIMTLNSYPIMDDKVTHAKIVVNKINCSERFFMPYAQVVYGNGNIADQLKDMKLGMLLQYFYAPECESILYLPKIYKP